MKKRLYILFFLLMLVSLTACDNGGSEEGQGIYQVYYVDSDSTGLVQEEYSGALEPAADRKRKGNLPQSD